MSRSPFELQGRCDEGVMLVYFTFSVAFVFLADISGDPIPIKVTADI